jgi:replication initiation and membrane attachment protein DnaB
MTKLVRQTVTMTEATQTRLKELGAHYDLNLYQMLDALINSTSDNDGTIMAAGSKIKAIAVAEREKVKKVKKQLSKLTSEQLTKLVAKL